MTAPPAPPGPPTAAERVLVYRLEHGVTRLGPYRVRLPDAGDPDGPGRLLVSDATWRHRPMPGADPMVRAALGDADAWWRDGWQSAFLDPAAIGRWFDTDWERAALAAHGFVVRAYAAAPAAGEVVLGASQALVRPAVIAPARCRGEWALAAVLADPSIATCPRADVPGRAAVRRRSLIR